MLMDQRTQGSSLPEILLSTFQPIRAAAVPQPAPQAVVPSDFASVLIACPPRASVCSPFSDCDSLLDTPRSFPGENQDSELVLADAIFLDSLVFAQQQQQQAAAIDEWNPFCVPSEACACEAVLPSPASSSTPSSPVAVSSPCSPASPASHEEAHGCCASNTTMEQISCHRCHMKKRVCHLCPKTAKHKFCGFCLRKYFGVETLEGPCPICMRSCPCSKCRRRFGASSK